MTKVHIYLHMVTSFCNYSFLRFAKPVYVDQFAREHCSAQIISQLHCSVLKKINDALLSLEDDQQRIDLLRSLDHEVQDHLSFAKEDIAIPTSINGSRGRPKTTTNKRLPSNFELKEKEDAKRSTQTKEEVLLLSDAHHKKDDSASIGIEGNDEDNCMSSVFVFNRGSKRRDPEIDYLQKAKR